MCKPLRSLCCPYFQLLLCSLHFSDKVEKFEITGIFLDILTQSTTHRPLDSVYQHVVDSSQSHHQLQRSSLVLSFLQVTIDHIFQFLNQSQLLSHTLTSLKTSWKHMGHVLNFFDGHWKSGGSSNYPMDSTQSPRVMVKERHQWRLFFESTFPNDCDSHMENSQFDFILDQAQTKQYDQSQIMMKMILLAVLFMGLLTPTFGIKFVFTMQPQSRRCFWQLLTESTPFHFKVEANSDMFEISMNHHDGTALVVNKRSINTKKIDSYASVTGQYSFCILNHDLTPQKMTYHLYQGLQLSDLGSLPKKQDSKVIDERVDQINAIYQTVKEQESYSRTVNEYNMELQKLVSFKSVGFVFLSITVVLIISFLHYLQIKRVLRNRKII